jgi:hypothetical protein
MTPRLLLACALLAGLLPAPAALGQRFDTDWWVSLKGRDKGAAKLEFGPLEEGVFDVEGFGATRGCGMLDEISGVLTVDSGGEISGTLDLSSSGDCATLEILSGKPNAAGTRLALRGELDSGGEPVTIRIDGQPFDTPEDLTGQDQSAVVSGRQIRSKSYDLSIDEGLAGFPAFEFTGTGAMEIDRSEYNPVPLAGRLVIDPKGNVFGVCELCVVDGLDFGGSVGGWLRRRDRTVPPESEDEEPTTISQARTTLLFQPENERRFRIKARFAEEVTGGGPIRAISVDPAVLGFPDAEVDGTAAACLEVSNTGSISFSGQALITSGGLDYVLLSVEEDIEECPEEVTEEGRPVGSIDYTIAAGESQVIFIQFQPTVAGTRRGTVTLTGGGDITATLTGQGTESPSP